MSFNLFNKSLLIGILILFLGIAIAPYLNVVSKEFDLSESVEVQEEATVTCYVFDKNGNSESEMVLSSDDFSSFYSKFEELNHMITYHSFSDETEVLKVEFVDFLDNMGLISKDLSRDDVISCLINPGIMWRRPLFSLLSNGVSGGRGSAFFCNFATLGEGSQFPVVILPRLIPILLTPIPRVIMRWNAYAGVTSCGGLLSGKGFIAEGAQQGTALGFWGIGFSVFLPPVMSFGFIGYALFATATAEVIHPWPPNRPPVISEENPLDGSVDVPSYLSELSFRIGDMDGDRMNYSVSTSPDIGGGSGIGVGDGVYSVDVSGLNSNTEYSWYVVVSDGEDISEETFSFRTAVEAPFVSDPFPVDGDGWVSVDLSQLSFSIRDLQGDSMDYTVETVPDIGSGSGSGVGDGTYSVDVGGLDYTTGYIWFVNVTDGEYWTRRVFVFKTQPVLVFDPFDDGWLYRKKITIDHDMVAGDLTNFPVLVSVVDPDLRDKAQSDGDDILFMDSSDVGNRLFHEIELFDNSNGELVAWVKIPSLSAGVDTVLYLYYGNSDCGNQQYPELVWNSDFIHVWHLGDSLEDSAGFDDGINHGTDIVSGKIGEARDFEQSEHDFIDFGDMDQPADGSLTTITWEAWIKPKIQDQIIMTKYNSLGGSQASYYIAFASNGKFRFNTYSGSGIRTRGITINSYSSIGQWIYITSTLNLGGINDIDVFVDGEEVAFSLEENSANFIRDLPDSDDIGRYRPQAGAKYSDAFIDEVRWSKIIRGNEWIKTSYNTMNDPSSFFSVGSEESAP